MVSDCQFIKTASGALYSLYHYPAQGDLKRQLLIVPPFAEEMNKSRKMVNQLARSLTKHGIATLVFDLFGCGDSAGDLAAADWEMWQQDVGAAYGYLRQRGDCPVSVLGVRLGALLAQEAYRSGELPGVEQWLLWQPVFNGRQFINQFLRLRLASNAIDGGAGAESMADLRQWLKDDGILEIAGYHLSAALITGIESATGDWAGTGEELGRLCWFELCSADRQRLLPASQRVVNQWQRQGVDVCYRLFSGAPFWQTQEISLATALLQQTREVLCEVAGGSGLKIGD